MKKKKNNKWLFWLILGSFFVIFCGLSVAMQSGYYETKLNQKTTLTNEQIKKFEADIKEGKSVDINNYLIEDKEDYNNNISKAGLKISSNVEKIMTQGISETLKILGKLFGTS